MRVIKRVAYQLSAPTVSSARMQDTAGLTYRLYPLSTHIERMLRLSGTSNYSYLSPYEASHLLYQISQEDFTKARSDVEKVDESLKETSSKVLPIRVLSYFINKEYRHQNLSRKKLNEKENFIKISSNYIKKLVKIVEVDTLPVGLASNSLYAAARLGIDFSEVMESKLLPLLDKKLGYLHALGCAETLWALAVLGNTGPVFHKVLKELQGRKHEKFLQVWTSPYNHLEYIRAQETSDNSRDELLLKASEVVKDEELKRVLKSLVSS